MKWNRYITSALRNTNLHHIKLLFHYFLVIFIILARENPPASRDQTCWSPFYLLKCGPTNKKDRHLPESNPSLLPSRLVDFRFGWTLAVSICVRFDEWTTSGLRRHPEPEGSTFGWFWSIGSNQLQFFGAEIREMLRELGRLGSRWQVGKT